jgi:hypothetical protein
MSTPRSQTSLWSVVGHPLSGRGVDIAEQPGKLSGGRLNVSVRGDVSGHWGRGLGTGRGTVGLGEAGFGADGGEIVRQEGRQGRQE